MEKPSKLKEEIKSIAWVIFIAFLIRTLIFEPYYIPSSSMEATLFEGDYIFATKYDYGYSRYSIVPFSPPIFQGRLLKKQAIPGDIVIFRPPHRMDLRYIKRLIGIPGDKVQILDDVVYINNQPALRKYVGSYTDKYGHKFRRYNETLPNGVSYNIINSEDSKPENTKVFEVPEGHYFFMGDNRNMSLDSRYDLGYVPNQNLIAKAKMIYFSTDANLWISDQNLADKFKQIGVWLSSFRFNRMFQSVYIK